MFENLKQNVLLQQRGQFILFDLYYWSKLEEGCSQAWSCSDINTERIFQKCHSESCSPHITASCRIIQMTWQEWKCTSRKIFSLKKSKHQLCLQTSITLMILLTIIGWKESNIDFVFTNRILSTHCSWQVTDPPGNVQETSSAAAWALVACFSCLYLPSATH